MTGKAVLRGVGVVLLVAAIGCYSVNSRLLEMVRPPEDLYRCLQLELGRAGYAIVGADRASGWLHAQKRIERIHEVVRAEIYATVIPDEQGGGSHLQMTDNSHAEDEAATILATCAPGATHAAT